MSIQVSSEQDYRKSVKSHAQYKFSRVIAQQGQGSTTNGLISVSGGNDLLFDIPQVPVNLSQSIIQLKITPPTQTAASSYYNWVFLDSLSFLQGIQLYTKAGVMLCDISNNLHNYTKVVWKAEIKRSEYENFDLYETASAGSGRMLRKSNALIDDTAAGKFTKRPNGSNASVNYLEHKYLLASTAANSATPTINVSLPLKMIQNTIFELDKTLYFNEVITLRLIFAPVAKYLFCSTNSGTDPTATPAASTLPANVSGVNLYLAMERNPDMANIMRGEIQKGFSLPIPCVNIFKQGSITGSTQSTTLRLNRAYGRNLLKIYHSLFGGSADGNVEDLNYAYNNSIGTAPLVDMTDYETSLQNQRLQDWRITLSSYDDWAIMQKKLEDSITLNSNVYRFNWFHLDDFTGSHKTTDKEYLEKNMLVGIPLDVEQRYDWYSSHTSASKQINHMDFVITQKLLQITPQGITCD